MRRFEPVKLTLSGQGQGARLHVKHWILIALGRIFERKLAKPEDVGRAQQIVDLFALGADSSLKERIYQTGSIVQITKVRK